MMRHVRPESIVSLITSMGGEASYTDVVERLNTAGYGESAMLGLWGSLRLAEDYGFIVAEPTYPHYPPAIIRISRPTSRHWQKRAESAKKEIEAHQAAIERLTNEIAIYEAEAAKCEN
jgi:hypothetical protein